MKLRIIDEKPATEKPVSHRWKNDSVWDSTVLFTLVL